MIDNMLVSARPVSKRSGCYPSSAGFEAIVRGSLDKNDGYGQGDITRVILRFHTKTVVL